MNIIDIYINPVYHIRSIIKVLLFLLLPTTYYFIFKEEKKDIKKIFIPRRKDFLKTLFLGIIMYIIIVGGYFLLRNYIDFSLIRKNLTFDAEVTPNNYIYVTIYIAFLNSLLEEFFFRGYSFISLKKQTNKNFAYIFSSLTFSIYHAGMTIGWFTPTIYILMLTSLFFCGCILNYLNEKFNNIYPSWIVHMFINFGINTVGLILFEII